MKNKLIIILFLISKASFAVDSNLSQGLNLKEKLFILTKKNLLGPNLSYKAARRYLFGKLHLKQAGTSYYIEDKYCNKVFTQDIGIGPMKIPNHLLLNCEHTWPQSRFNKSFSIRLQKNDLHHLYPVDSKANSTRLNDIFAEVQDGKVISNDCTVATKGNAIGSNLMAFEPPNSHKGNVARALFYFSIRYKSPISETQEFYLRRWHTLDPVDEDEKIRNKQIQMIQNNTNPFIDDPTLVSKIHDF